MRYLIIIMAMIGSINLSAIEFRTLPSSALPEGASDKFGTRLSRLIEYEDGVLASFFASDTLFFFDGKEWDEFVFLDKDKYSIISNITASGDQVYFQQSQGLIQDRKDPVIFKYNPVSNQLDSFNIEWDEFPNTGNDYSGLGYFRRLREIEADNDGNLILLSILSVVDAVNGSSVSTFQYSEVVVVNSQGDILNYYRSHSDKWEGYNNRPDLPLPPDATSLFLYDLILAKDNGDIILTGGGNVGNEGYIMILSKGSNEWVEEGIGYDISTGKGYEPSSIVEVAGNVYIVHSTTNPTNSNIYERGLNGWNIYGIRFADILPSANNPFNGESDFRPTNIFHYGGNVYSATTGYGMIKLGENSFESYPIIFDTSGFESSRVAGFIATETSLWANVYPEDPTALPIPVQIDPAGLTDTSVEEGDTERITISLQYYDTMGNELTEEDIQSGIPYLELTKYKDGGFKVEKKAVK